MTDANNEAVEALEEIYELIHETFKGRWFLPPYDGIHLGPTSPIVGTDDIPAAFETGYPVLSFEIFKKGEKMIARMYSDYVEVYDRTRDKKNKRDFHFADPDFPDNLVDWVITEAHE